jgi:5-methylcytosine-specific restriction endonuclease McrA
MRDLDHRRYLKYPEKFHKSNKKQLKKLSKELDLTCKEYKYANMSWKKTVKRLGNGCVYCGSMKKLQAHHIFSVSKHPLLATNLNNGIVLCAKCHRGENMEDNTKWRYSHKIKRFQKMSLNYSLHSLNGQL